MNSDRLTDPFDDLRPGLVRALNHGRDLFYSFLAHDLLRKISNNPSATQPIASAFKRTCDDDVTGYQLGLATRFLIESRVAALPDAQQFVRTMLGELFTGEGEGGVGFFLKYQQQSLQDSDRSMMLAHLLFQQLPKELVEAEEYGAVGVVQRLLAIIALFDGLTKFAGAIGMGEQALADRCRAMEPKLDFAFNFIMENLKR
jgi:hypothetical protein